MPCCLKVIPILLIGVFPPLGSAIADSHHPGAGRHQGMSKGGQGMQRHYRHHGKHHGAHGGSHLIGPSWKRTLTDDQIRKIDHLHADLAKVRAPLKARMTVAKTELAVLTTADAPEAGAIDEKIREILDLKGRMLRAHSDHVIELRTLLTPEQRASFDMHVLKKAGRKHGKVH